MRQPKTVSKDGENLRPTIDGVVTDKRPVHTDLRGRVFEIYRGADTEIFKEEIRWMYGWSVRSGQLKGWGKHEAMADRYVLISGEVSVFYLTLERGAQPIRGRSIPSEFQDSAI